MLLDPVNFKKMEEFLVDEGKIKKFEKDSGKILGRVMITLGSLPCDLKDEILKENKEEDLYVFNCSFDFYDAYLGIAIHKNNFELASGIWITEQEEDADPPSKDWIDFFIRILYENIIESNVVAYPIFAFVNNESDMVIGPAI